MLKTIANSKNAILFLNQVHHANVMFDHDTNWATVGPSWTLLYAHDLGSNITC